MFKKIKTTKEGLEKTRITLNETIKLYNQKETKVLPELEEMIKAMEHIVIAENMISEKWRKN